MDDRVLAAVSTPDRVRTSFGEFLVDDGVPTADSLADGDVLLFSRLMDCRSLPEPDGSVVLHVAPEQPVDTPDGHWIGTDPRRNWFAIPRFYNPTPLFFDKSWQAGDIEKVE